MATISRTTLITKGLAIFLVLVLIKIAVGVSLVFYADYAQRQESKLFESIPSTIAKPKRNKDVNEVDVKVDQSIKERLELVEDLAAIERYTVYKGRIL